MSTMTETPAAVGGTRYKEVKSALLAALAAHEWKGGEAIPAEKRLAERFGVSIGTLRKAIDELCAENILIRHQGLGTFVAMHQRDRHFFRFFRIVRNDGDKTYPTVSLVNFRKAKATQQVAARLRISEGAPVFQFTNQLALHGVVVIVENIVVPQARFPDLTEAALRNRPNTLYNFYQDAFGINVVSTDERVRVGQASELESGLLELASGAPVLEVERIAYSYNEQPVEYRLTHVNTQEYDYVSSYARPSSGT
ncbi:GntR family transcriptional regulator [Paraburkholderia fungorum]|uniref:GntR family transcriptional regulator n=1 Tax=Paraburkholderia fungorum TaxID=134537 RepID=A0A420G6P5_9BURK|nr:GntR family transcriptional regulator [Paraburkholderia fungorum]RKF40814.1 GntR family transcriptional regulator [Paraburkholderia fungorum]